jgi:ATP-dependent Clp protease ATP-binding subunit ClpC
VFKGLTQRLRRILSVDAQNEARRVNAVELQPEHVIIALLKDGAGTACKALLFLRIDLAEFRRILENGLSRSPSVLLLGDVPPSERTKKMLEAASAEARSMGNDYIGTEHLLFAAMQEKDSSIKTFLNQREVDVDMLRVVIQTTFNRGNSPETTQSGFSGQSYFSRREDPREYTSRFGSEGEHKAPRGSRVRPASYPVLTPTLDEFARDLTAQARMGKLDPVVGRRKETDRALRILARRTKNNPVLVGEPGVGKTAIVEGLAQLFAA